MVRIATALVLAPGLWALLRLTSATTFFAITLVVIGIGSWECYRMLEAAGAKPLKTIGLVAAMAVAWSFAGSLEIQLALVLGGAATISVAMLVRETPREMLETSLHTAFPVLFIGLSFGYLLGLRTMPGEDGNDLLLMLFLCVILADTAAFYTGRALGRHRMSPRMSPKKTWEGAAAGVGASVIGGLVAHVWFFQRLPLFHALGLGALLGFAAIAGDLAESMIKRAATVKDSSRLLPGHGGVLDRTDSLIFSGPTLYYYYRYVLQGLF